jgi:hypothetical protein
MQFRARFSTWLQRRALVMVADRRPGGCQLLRDVTYSVRSAQVPADEVQMMLDHARKPGAMAACVTAHEVDRRRQQAIGLLLGFVAAHDRLRRDE